LLYEAASQIGGQLNLARAVPGKQEFDELLRYFGTRIREERIRLHLSSRPSAAELAAAGFDRIVVATGVRPRSPAIEGIEHEKVIRYPDLLSGLKDAGERVAIIGAGGIGFDVAEYLLQDESHEEASRGSHVIPAAFFAEWGVDPSFGTPGGLKPAQPPAVRRRVTLLQRTPGKTGRTLGLSTGWALRARLDQRGLKTVSGCSYERIDSAGLHLRVDGEERLLEVDTVVICAGQDSENRLAEELRELGIQADLVGGAERAAELDALRAIDQGTRTAMTF
jgi:2,4-dienoyl-CoA reductase (NADPH2)